MRLGIDRFQPNVEFSRYAREQLQSSDDIDLLKGALAPFFNWDGHLMALGERPASLLRERNYLDVGSVSESRYTQSSCEAPWPVRN
jgi:hypothetical protein